MKTSRRNFLKSAVTTGLGLAILPNWVIGKGVGPNSKVNVAFVGLGNRGEAATGVLKRNKNVRFAAYCDVDEAMLQRAPKLDETPPYYKDFREMLDKQKDIDAVCISTPDHSHYPIAAWSMAMGKHTFVEKPLCRTFWECSKLKRIAKKMNVITQMGNQGHLSNGWRTLKDWYDKGIFGDITELHQWTNRGRGGPADMTMPPPSKAPDTLDFKAWLCASPDIPYNDSLHPGKWRMWQAFGTGSLGDIGCHLLDWGYSALGLGYPIKITGYNDKVGEYAWSPRARVVFEFKNPIAGRPNVKLFWYDGKQKPEKVPESLKPLIASNANAVIAVGTKNCAIADNLHATVCKVAPYEKMREMLKNKEIPARLTRKTISPHDQWIESCLAGVKAESDFVNYAADFAQIVNLGIIASFFPCETLEFDSKKLEFSNKNEANAKLRSSYDYKKEYIAEI